MSETDGEVFQYVGTAYPTIIESIRQPVEGERPMPNDEIIGYVQALIDQKDKAEERQRDAELRLAHARQNVICRYFGAMRRRLRGR